MNNCPTCNEMLVFPRGSYAYCEECGYPDEDFSEEFSYPKIGERLEKYQPHLEFYDDVRGSWVPSGVITKTMKEDDRGFYRVRVPSDILAENKASGEKGEQA